MNVGGALLAHMCGDYVVQTDYMASRKTTEHLPAAVHAVSYTACFLPLTRNMRALAVIGGTHFVIDRWRLARHLCWAKNQLAPAAHRYMWAEGKASGTGYPLDRPIWLTTWLMIAADNTVHTAINAAALSHWT